MDKEAIAGMLSQLRAEAGKGGKEIDESFWAEVANYVRHDVVCDFEPEQLETALDRLGRLAIQLPGDRVGGGHFRKVVFYVCTKDFGTCDNAATTAAELPFDALTTQLTLGMKREIARIHVDLEATSRASKGGVAHGVAGVSATRTRSHG